MNGIQDEKDQSKVPQSEQQDPRRPNQPSPAWARIVIPIILTLVFCVLLWFAPRVGVPRVWLVATVLLAGASTAVVLLWEPIRTGAVNFLTTDKETKDFRRLIWFFGSVILTALLFVALYQPCCSTVGQHAASVPASSRTNTPAADTSATNQLSASLTTTNLAVPGSNLNSATNAFAGIEGHASGFRTHSVISLLWSFACMAGGALVGFLFGIPKVFQPDRKQTAHGAAQATPQGNKPEQTLYGQEVNTNLTEISDWITKIIVGLGLINLKQLPGLTTKAGKVLNESLQSCGCGGDHLAFAIAIILFFSISGFLFGYVMTRIFLAAAFSRADLDALNTAQQKADSNTAVLGSIQDAMGVLRKEVASVVGVQETKKPSESTPPAVPQDSGTSTAAPEPQIPNVAKPAEESSPASVTEGGLPKASSPPQEPMYYKPDPGTQLDSLAQAYNNFRSPVYQERVRTRNRLVEDMAVLLNRYPYLKDNALTAALRGDNAYIAALSTSINAEPGPNDFATLARIAPLAQYQHCRYRVVTAFGKLFLSRYAGRPEIPVVFEILKTYYLSQPDETLAQRIREVLSLISQVTNTSLSLPPN